MSASAKRHQRTFFAISSNSLQKTSTPEGAYTTTMAGCALNIILLTFLVSHCAGERLRYDVPLDHSKHLYWDFNYESQIIDFLLEVKMSPNEFFGFGFSDYGEATEADLVLFWADLHGKYHFQVGMCYQIWNLSPTNPCMHLATKPGLSR